MQRSIKRRAVDPSYDPRNFPNIHPVLARIFYTRGVVSESELDYQLNRLLKPQLKGVERAVSILAEALAENRHILIIGDYDADGATSTALAVRCLRALGAENVSFLVPNRFEYGYGLSPEIVHVAARLKPDVIVTVDNGIASVDGVREAKRRGYKVVVTDHHLPGNDLPEADAIVNPNQPGCEFISKSAAGVGVLFYVVSALRSHLRSLGWFAGDRCEPNLANYLDIVALGTVADVVPLDFNNRILVAQGLHRMRAGQLCPGIRALLEVGRRDPAKVSAMDLGFIVGPRLNAAGRLDDMSLGIRCLLTDDTGEALQLAQELDQLNQERRSIETSMQVEALQEIEGLLESLQGDVPLGVCLYREDWHQGVIGILASRIKDRYHRPVIVFANDGEGQIKGSGRSVRGVHLRDVLDIIATSHPGMLKKFGGHAMAAGLSLELSQLDAFTEAFSQAINQHLGGAAIESFLETDGELAPSELDLDFVRQVETSGPWGQAFPEPCFDGAFRLLQQKIVGGKHLKLVLAFQSDPNQIVDAIAFNVDTQLWPNYECNEVRIVYRVSINEFRGQRSTQLIIDYIEPVAVVAE